MKLPSISSKSITKEKLVEDLGRAKELGFGVLDKVAQYNMVRGKLIKKVIKYPFMKNYEQALVELDQKEYFNLKDILLDLRNNYVLLVCEKEGNLAGGIDEDFKNKLSNYSTSCS